MLRGVTLSRDDVERNVGEVREAVGVAASRAGRDATDVTLVAAAKTVPVEAVRWAIDAGVSSVGHNYVQELRDAHLALADHDVRWHYIGTLRSGSAHQVADMADVVETVAGEHAARRLAGRAARAGRTVDALVEVDFTQRRSGVTPAGLERFVDLVASLDGVRLRGLMTVPPISDAQEDARPWFSRLRDLRDRLRTDRPWMLDLSMGMSLDYEVAVEEGATMVRIGTALFGPRTP
jgi:pyridoxal phosphate enzyme (YggS family)